MRGVSVFVACALTASQAFGNVPTNYVQPRVGQFGLRFTF
jgi:hypothetical protein